jgi:hypothetical protein
MFKLLRILVKPFGPVKRLFEALSPGRLFNGTGFHEERKRLSVDHEHLF